MVIQRIMPSKKDQQAKLLNFIHASASKRKNTRFRV